MTDREKLIELLSSIWGYEGDESSAADYLLANGVTFAKDTDVPSKWIPHTQPPKDWRDKDGELINYLIYMPLFGVDIGNYMEPMGEWLCLGIPCNVTHWMPLPAGPEEADCSKVNCPAD